mgnify:CR=1 FL=1
MKRGCSFALLLVGVAALARAEDPASIRLATGPSCVFAERTAAWRVTVSDGAAYAGSVAWSLALDGGVVARREQNVAIRPEAPAELDLQIDLPAVRAGVEVEGRLSATLLDGQRQLRTELEIPVWTFGQDPAVQKKQWLKELDLRVYDPEGGTLQKLNDLGWPCRILANLAAVETLGDATLIVGEGCSLRSQRGLMESVLRAAQHGARVVFLAPTDGEFSPPGTTEAASGPTALHFYEAAFAQTLDKRVAVPAQRAALRLTGTRAGALVTVEAAGGWSCLEARWANGGTLLLVGYGLLDTWEDSPVPRHLLFKMLEYVTPEKEKES